MPVRTCRVSFRDADCIVDSVEVQGESLFEAAAAGLKVFRDQSWGAAALAPGVMVRIEVTPPTTVHEVPVVAVERWLRSPNASPKEALVKRAR